MIPQMIGGGRTLAGAREPFPLMDRFTMATSHGNERMRETGSQVLL
jgi:hypothetical protein